MSAPRKQERDFEQLQASRPPFNHARTFEHTQVPRVRWELGHGANDERQRTKQQIEIDPYEEGRSSEKNFNLLISAIIPRPIGLISTQGADGKSVNLALFSFFNVITHDPPTFIVGFASSFQNAKDTPRNLVDTKECTINIISEQFIEAANATSVNAPYGISEWELSGLTPVASKLVKPSFVQESPFAIEGRLMNVQEVTSPKSGKVTALLAVIEGVRFHVHDDVLNESKDHVDPKVLRPVSRIGGISYARVLEGMEMPMLDFNSVSRMRK